MKKKKTTQPSINPEIISQTTKLKLLLLQNKIKEELKQLWHDCNKIKAIVTTKQNHFSY